MSDVDQSTPQDSFEVEITNLDPLEHASHPLSTRWGRMLVHWQQPQYRRVRRWLSNGLLVCLILTFLVTLLNPSVGITSLLATYWSSLRAQPALTVKSSFLAAQGLTPVSNEIRCPVATAWSPDSSRVALLGYTQSCAQGQYVPAQINFYDVATAHQTTHWSPDGAILAALQSYPGISPSMQDYLARKPDFATDHGATPVIHYLHMLWSPDHSRLALSFVAVNYVFAYAGLFLVHPDGSQAQVLLEPERTGLAPGTATPLLWDLQSKSVTTLATLPPALTYTWDAHDQLTPASPLDAQTDLSVYANSPPGNPIGERSFTIWQPGHIAFQVLGVSLWSTNFATWSPDGRYFVTNFAFTGLMEPPGQAFPTVQNLNGLEVKDIPHLPTHDLALLSSSVAPAQTLAWNPAGTLLAAYYPAGFVNIYNCQTGYLVHQLFSALGTTPPLTGSAALLNWSPDGRSLSLASPQGKLLTLWGSAVLLAH
jgi:WD40 repeat protein